VSLALLITGGLFLRSFLLARGSDVGFRVDGVTIATVDVSAVGTEQQQSEVLRKALERIERLPGVAAATLVERMPFSPNVNTTEIHIDGYQPPTGRPAFEVDSTRVGARYFELMDVPLIEGRHFDRRDTPESPAVAIVSETFARRYWPHASAVGHTFRLRGPAGPPVEIVGVTRDYKVRTVGEASRPYVHFSMSQRRTPRGTIVARTSGDPVGLAANMRRELLTIEPDLVFLELQPLRQSMATSLFPARVGALLIGAFGLLALVIASIGLYGVVAFAVSRRTREIGIRVALGADRYRVLRLFIVQGMALVGVGLFVGSVLAFGTAKILQGALYGVTPVDPITYLATIALLGGVALAANIVPALRAARLDPVVALRAQ
jgi:predicted permease